MPAMRERGEPERRSACRSCHATHSPDATTTAGQIDTRYNKEKNRIRWRRSGHSSRWGSGVFFRFPISSPLKKAVFSRSAHKSECTARHGGYQHQPDNIPKHAVWPSCHPVNYNRCQRQPRQTGQKAAPNPFVRVPRLAHPPNLAQQQAQIIGRAFERVCFAHIGLSSHPSSPTASGLAHMGKGSFAPFAAPADSTAAPSSRAPAGGWPERPCSCATGLSVQHRLFCRRSGIYVRTPLPAKSGQQTIVVIALVHHRFLNLWWHCPPAPDWLRPGSTSPARSADRTCRQR